MTKAFTNTVTLVALLNALLFVEYVIGGELRDRRLPSEKALERSAMTTTQEYQRPRSTVPHEVYEVFRRDVAKLSSDEKRKLEAVLNERISKARVTGEADREHYNLTLLGILKQQ
jgi:hypothetical protein